MYKIEFPGKGTAAKTQNRVDISYFVDIFDENSQLFTNYRDVAMKPTPLRESSFNVMDYGQKLNDIQSTPALSRRESGDIAATRSDSVLFNDDSGQQSQQETNEPEAADDRAKEQTVNSYELKDDVTRPDRHQRRLRAAEARRRLELLDEERELQDNLAEFWDSRFDKPRRWRPSTMLPNSQTRAAPSPENKERAVNSRTPVRGTKNC